MTSKTIGFNKQNQKFLAMKPFVSKVKTLGFDYGKLSFQLVGTSKGIYLKQPKQISFPSKSICFDIKVLYFGEDLKNTILFYSLITVMGTVSFEERVTILVFAHYPAESIYQ